MTVMGVMIRFMINMKMFHLAEHIDEDGGDKDQSIIIMIVTKRMVMMIMMMMIIMMISMMMSMMKLMMFHLAEHVDEDGGDKNPSPEAEDESCAITHLVNLTRTTHLF